MAAAAAPGPTITEKAYKAAKDAHDEIFLPESEYDRFLKRYYSAETRSVVIRQRVGCWCREFALPWKSESR